MAKPKLTKAIAEKIVRDTRFGYCLFPHTLYCINTHQISEDNN